MGKAMTPLFFHDSLVHHARLHHSRKDFIDTRLQDLLDLCLVDARGMLGNELVDLLGELLHESVAEIL